MKTAEAFNALGLPLDATPEDVQRAWRTLVKTLHPDVAPHRQGEFELGMRAYKTALAAAKVCPICKGDGVVQRPRDFKVLTVRCAPCEGRGTR